MLGTRRTPTRRGDAPQRPRERWLGVGLGSGAGTDGEGGRARGVGGRLIAFGAVVALCLAVAPAMAQEESSGTAVVEEGDPQDGGAGAMSAEEARRLLAEPLPESAEARYALLQRQWTAARRIEDRARQIEIAKALIPLGRGRPDGEGWIRLYLITEYTWGSSGAALAACEPLLADRQLGAAARAGVALRQTYFLANGGQIAT